MSEPGIALIPALNTVQQLTSHADLFQDVSRSPAPPASSRRGSLDAVIVPASRPAEHLEPLLQLATSLSVPVVILCSKKARADQVEKLVATKRGARSLIVQMPDPWTYSGLPARTSAAEFQHASAHRGSGLSRKRNLGLLLARLHGWNKIAFVDDDIDVSRRDIARLAGQLDKHQVVGMVVRQFPDNSVVCHARRVVGFGQGVFVSGAVLGVHSNGLPLSFFPDVYNEDWFFFAEEAATRTLRCAGDAKQAEFDPFQSSDRARWEEFGDLLAEGLYALIGKGSPDVPFGERLDTATATYWSRFIDARSVVLAETMTVLKRYLNRDPDNHRFVSALTSLRAAQKQLVTIAPDLCVSFLDAWQADLADWQRSSNGVNIVGSTREAMDFLDVKVWTRVRFETELTSWRQLQRRFTA